MKTLIVAALCLAVTATPTPAQTANTMISLGGTAADTSSPTARRVVERGANHRVWQWETYETSPKGKITPHVHKYTELASGLHYWLNNQWVEAREEITLLPPGSAAAAAAVQGQHQAYFPGDIYNGVIEVVTAEGLDLKTRPVGLTYDDGNHTVLIAALTNSVGELIGSNQIIYPNAFSGVAADLVLTYRQGGFESEVVFREQLPDPTAVYGLAAARVRLQLLTEFFDSPEPGQVISPADELDGLTDATLSFGSLKMVRGKAFTSGSQDGQSPGARGVQVYKTWLSVASRNFLIEAVPYYRIAPQLQTLPLHAGISQLETKTFAGGWLPAYRRAQATTNIIELAKSDYLRRPGVVLDYVAVNTVQTNFTFLADATYYISSGINYDAKTVFQGGTVIKYGAAGSILNGGAYECQTGPYRPAIFTSMNDDTVGETISGSSGSPGAADSSNDLDIGTTGGQLKNLRFSYTTKGVTQQGLDVWDCQFINCGGAGLSELGSVAKLHNVLFAKCRPGYAIIQNAANPLTLIGENITADQCAGLFNPTNSGYLTNCLFTGLGTALPAAATNNSTVVIRSTNTGVYQIVGAGSYYLATNSPARNAGTTGITPALLTELRQKTTKPPQVISATAITTNRTFGPRAPRDTNPAPDAGYHYDVLDYAFGDVGVTTNVTFAAGTAVGWFEANGTMTGLSLNDGASLTFQGTADAPCDFARYDMVQEGCNGNWTDRGYLGGVVFNGSDPVAPPQLAASFTRWQIPAGGPNQFRDNWGAGVGRFTACEFYGGDIASYAPAYYFTNCLFYAVTVAFWDQNDAANLALQNCTFYNGGLALCRNFGQTPSFWTIRNTAFDGTALIALDDNRGDTNYMAFDYNTYSSSNLTWQAYDFGIGVPSTNKLETVGTHDFMVTNYNWQTGLLGDFYQPTNSPLIDRGCSDAVLLGLSGFTTQTNEALDSSLVDIGHHYPLHNAIYAASGSFQDVSNAVLKASSGWTVVVPPGSYTWTNTLNINQDIQLIGAGIGQTVITDEVPPDIDFPGSKSLIFYDSKTNGVCRIAGFTFAGGTTQRTNNGDAELIIHGYSPGFRIDHCRWAYTFKNAVTFAGDVAGVVDHCRFDTQWVNGGWRVTGLPNGINVYTGGRDGFGNVSWATPVAWGTTNHFIYIEDCIFNEINDANGYTAGVDDVGYGGRLCLRYNIITNMFAQMHGTESEGARGGRALEAYGNTFIMNGSNMCCGQPPISFRSGTGVVFSNTISQWWHGIIGVNTFRGSAAYVPWGGAYGENPWDSNSPPVWTGHHTGTNGMTYLVDDDKTKPWTANQFFPSYQIRFNNGTTSGMFSNIATNTTNAVYYQTQPQDGSTMHPLTNGDAYAIYRVYPILDQPGTGMSDLITNTLSGPVIATNGIAAWPHQVTEPIYQWGNTVNGVADYVETFTYWNEYGPGTTTTVVIGRDVINNVAKTNYTPLVYPHPLVK